MGRPPKKLSDFDKRLGVVVRSKRVKAGLTRAQLAELTGIPEDLIIEIVGHSTRSMSRAYKARGNQERLLAAMNQLSQLLASGKSDAQQEALPSLGA